MNIRTKLTVAFLSLAIIGIGLDGFATFYFAKEQIIKLQGEKLQALASNQKNDLGQVVEAWKNKAKLVASRTQLRALMSEQLAAPENNHYPKILRILTDAMQSIDKIQFISLCDPSGHEIATVRRFVFEAPPCEAFDKPNLDMYSFQKTWVPYDDGEQLALVTGPVRDEGRVLGSIQVVFVVDELLALVNNFNGLGKTGETLLAQRNLGGDAVFLTPLRYNVNKRLDFSVKKEQVNVPITQALMKKELFLSHDDVVDYRGVPVLAATAYVDELDWGVVAKIDRDEALLPINSLLTTIVLASIALIVLVFLLGRYISYGITKPIELLVNATKNIIDGDFSRRVEVSSNDEIGLLTRTYNQTLDFLEENTEQLRLLKLAVDNSEELIMLTGADPDNPEIIYVSKGSMHVCGYEPWEMLGRTPHFLQGEKTEREKLDAIREALETQMPFEGELVNYRKGGEEYWVHLNIMPVKDETGKVTHFASVQRDITERKRLEQKVLESEQRYELAITGSSVGIWDWSIPTNALFWSSRFKEIVGIADKKFRPHLDEFTSRLHPDERDQVMEAVQQHLEHRIPYDIEYRLRHHDGYYVWIHARGQAIWNEHGEPLRMAGSVDDITTAKISAKQLEESETQFRVSMTFAPIGMALVSLDGRWLQVNRALIKMLGYSENEMLRLDLQAITHPSDLHLGLTQTDLMLRGELEFYQLEKRFIHKQGYEVWALISVSLVLDEKQKPKHFVAQIQDVSDRKKTEEKTAQLIRALSNSNKELDDFAYVASHDLKSPLRVIDNTSRWLEEDLADHLDEDSQENLQLLRSRVRRMEKLLDDLLEYSRVGRKMDESFEETISGEELMKGILLLLAKPEGMTVIVSPEIYALTFYRMPLEQVLLNLISNAIKHHDKQEGQIEVSIHDNGDAYLFCVKDDGPGIPAKYHAQVFKMFQTLKPRDRVEGSGMGLAMVRKQIEFFGGTITVESEEGKGSAFKFTWPKKLIFKAS